MAKAQPQPTDGGDRGRGTGGAPPAAPPGDGDDQIFDLGMIKPLPKLAMIDGIAYEMVDVNELGIGPRARLDKVVQRIMALEKKGERILAKEEQEYDARLLAAARMILPNCPEQIVEKLSLGSRGELVARFLVEMTLDSPRLQMLGRLMQATPSVASSMRTAATRSAGSRSRRH